MVSYDEQVACDELSLSHPDPLVLELNRLQNLLKEKDRELGAAQGEIKALRATEALKDKAVEELINKYANIGTQFPHINRTDMRLKTHGKNKKKPQTLLTFECEVAGEEMALGFERRRRQRNGFGTPTLPAMKGVWRFYSGAGDETGLGVRVLPAMKWVFGLESESVQPAMKWVFGLESESVQLSEK
ncbi:hypothetical protein CMV_000970 [Castanea mollissima]|uniref:Uncharacterized protein n=1 Tax=Castanea mollissima TaxID=60419 RepID=A0A8J4W6X2_9ROSI|nr:hypothetical protein CMV_000970 [Castanea mollissima]